MAWRGVHKAGAGIVRDVIAVEQRHPEVVAASCRAADARTTSFCQYRRRDRSPAMFISRHTRLPEHIGRKLFGEDEFSPGLAQLPSALRSLHKGRTKSSAKS